MKRAFCLILAALMLFTCISCSETNSEEASSAENAAVPAEQSAEVVEEEPEGIPEPVLPEKDYEGAAFKILTRGRYSGSFEEVFLIAEELNGEPVNDAIFARNSELEEKFNIDMTYEEDPATADQVKKLVMVNDGSVDVIDTQGTALGSLAMNGYLMNLLRMEYINLDTDYWSRNVTNDLQIAGRLYMAPGDFSMARLESTFFLFFNKVLVSNYNLEDPYTLIDEGRWTIDKYCEYIDAVSADLDGDGKYDKNDLYGMLYEPADILYYTVSTGIELSQNDDEKGLVCTVYSEKTADVLEKMKTCFDSRSTIQYQEIAKGVDTAGYDNLWEWARTLFANRQYLFLPCGMFELDALRDMEDDFGIAPMPKYDEAQTDYYHRTNEQSCLFAVPISCSDFDRAGIVMEYGSWFSNKTLLPAYYEVTVKQKRIRDEKAVEMIDIIRRTARYQASDVYNLGISSVLTTALTTGDFASTYTKMQKKIEATIEKVYETFQSLE